tara:strand:+ start:11 stop:844 length:834 start_codon:yes stop_codon:yes gene_type:complete
MRIVIFISLLFVLSSCSSEIEEKVQLTQNKISKNIDTTSVQSNLEYEKPMPFIPIIGERIDGPANIRDSINGKIIFELFDNALVETSLLENNWFTIGLFVKVDSIQNHKGYIEPNQKLIDFEENIIGVTKDTVRLIMDDKDYWLIWGKTYKDNIKKESIPELELLNLIEKGNIDSVQINRFIRNFNFKYDDRLNFEGIKLYFIYQSLIIDPSPRDRISLLFDNDTLIGFVHSRSIKATKFETYELIRGHKLTIIKEINKLRLNKIIENRKLWYSSID